MKILLAVDGSIHSNEAVSEVARRPWPKGTVIRVLSAIENVPLGLVGLPATYFTEMSGSIKSHAQAAVDAAIEKLINTFGDSVEVYGDTINGSPKHVIVDEAKTWGADLIVLGAYGHGGVERFLIGSVPQAVIHHAHCSVEVVRGRGPAKH
ncbi:MAG: universal stress protein [Acidobacteriota bacterium]|nr:universal stress protein [Acidobacteriota bacterium]